MKYYIWMQDPSGGVSLLEEYNADVLSDARVRAADTWATSRSRLMTIFVTEGTADEQMEFPLFSFRGSADPEYDPAAH